MLISRYHFQKYPVAALGDSFNELSIRFSDERELYFLTSRTQDLFESLFIFSVDSLDELSIIAYLSDHH